MNKPNQIIIEGVLDDTKKEITFEFELFLLKNINDLPKHSGIYIITTYDRPFEHKFIKLGYLDNLKILSIDKLVKSFNPKTIAIYKCSEKDSNGIIHVIKNNNRLRIDNFN